MLSVKVFKQKPSFCGPTCLQMVFQHYGLKASQDEIAKVAGTTLDSGTNKDQMIHACSEFGFKAKVVDHYSIKELHYQINVKKIPVIVDYFKVWESHYSVAVGIDSKHLYLADPEAGKIVFYEIDDFKKIWFGFTGNKVKSTDNFYIKRVYLVTPTKKLIQKLKRK